MCGWVDPVHQDWARTDKQKLQSHEDIQSTHVGRELPEDLKHFLDVTELGRGLHTRHLCSCVNIASAARF